MGRVVLALGLDLRITRDEGRIEGVLVIIIVGEGGIDLRQGEIGILLDNLCCTVPMGHMISDQVEYPMTSAVNTGHFMSVHGDMGVAFLW